MHHLSYNTMFLILTMSRCFIFFSLHTISHLLYLKDFSYSIQLFQQTVIDIREIILKCECEFSSLFSLLVHAPSENNKSFEIIVKLADNIMITIPPEKLKKNADYEMKKIIEIGLIQSFLTPKHLRMKSVQSDWVLLRNKNTKTSSSILIHHRKLINSFEIKVKNIDDNLNYKLQNDRKNIFHWLTGKNQEFIFHLFNSLKNSKIRRLIRKKNLLIEKNYSYVGPFKEHSSELKSGMSFSMKNFNWYLKKWTKTMEFDFLTSLVFDKLQNLDESFHSIEFLLLVTTVLAGILSSSVYYYQ